MSKIAKNKSSHVTANKISLLMQTVINGNPSTMSPLICKPGVGRATHILDTSKTLHSPLYHETFVVST